MVSVYPPLHRRGVPGDSRSQQWGTRGSTPRGPPSCHVLLPPRPRRPAARPPRPRARGRDGDAPRVWPRRGPGGRGSERGGPGPRLHATCASACALLVRAARWAAEQSRVTGGARLGERRGRLGQAGTCVPAPPGTPPQGGEDQGPQGRRPLPESLKPRGPFAPRVRSPPKVHTA